jgi:hypothetical protein
MLQTAVFTPPAGSADSVPTRQPINVEIVKGEPVAPVLVDLQTISLPAGAANQNLDNDQNAAPYNFANTAGDLNIISSFKAIDYTQSQQGVPPNPALMVGSQHVVVSVNSSFQVFDKNGTTLIGPTLFKDLWGSSCGTGSATMVLFFPFSTYDEQFGRYVMGVAGHDSAVNNGANSYLCLAVSQTNSATGQWYLYSFNGNPGTGPQLQLDFPRFGTGQEALFLGAGMYDNFTFVSNRIFAFEKTAMYNGSTAALVTADIGNLYNYIIPADIKGYSSGNWPANPDETHYFVEAEFGFGDEIRVFGFEDPWGTPSFGLVGTIPVSSYGLTFDQPQAGTSHKIKGIDNRMMDVAYGNGRLWATHHIGCNPGGGSVNCLRWYEIDVSDPVTPELVQEGTFSSSGNYRSFPALTVNDCGDMLIGYTKTSSAIFPGVYGAGREAQDAPGQLKSETELHAGEVFYLDFESQPYKWGYYTTMTLDPDGRTFWHIGPYARLQPDARWSTWVGAFTWAGCEPPPTPTPSPSSTLTPTNTPTATPTPTPSTTPTPSPSPTNTPTGTPTPTPTLTATPNPSQTSTPTATPTASPTAFSYRNWIPIVMK